MQKILTRIIVAALFLVPFFALLPLPHIWPFSIPYEFFFPFITGKAFLFRTLVEIALACWVVLAFLDPRYRPRWTVLTTTVTVFAVVTLAADLLGVNPIRSIMSNFERMEGWLIVAHLWGLYMVMTHVFGADDEGRRLWRRWFQTSLVVAGIVMIYAICQLLGWAGIHQGSTRLDASLGNAAYLAIYVFMHLGIAAYLFRTLALKVWRHVVAVVCVALAILFFTVPMFSMVAQGILGLIVLAVAVGMSPYLTFTLFGAFIIFETQTRGTIIGLGVGIIATCAMCALLVAGVTWKKVLALLSYPFIIILYALFVLIMGLFSLSLWWLFWIGVAYTVALAVYVFMSRGAVTQRSVIIGRWVATGIIALGFVAGGVFYLVKDASFIKNSPSLDRIASISLSDTKTQARAYIWPMALKGFTERPILGWGQENFNYIFNANYNPKMWSQEQWFDRAHSVFLDWLVAAGAVGLIVYVALYVLLIASLWRSSSSVAEKSVLTGLVIGYAIHNIFVFDNAASYILFFALLAFAGTHSRRQSIGTSSPRMYHRDMVEYVVMPIMILALAAGIYWLMIRPIQANTRLIAALSACTQQQVMPDPTLFSRALAISATADQEVREQIMSCAANVFARPYPGPIKQAFYDLARTAIADQTAYAPQDARMYVIGGSMLNAVRPVDAVPLLERAHELTPRKQGVNIQLAGSYINLGRNDEAVALLKEAYESDQTNTEAQSAYIMGLVFAGHDDQARTIASTSIELFENEKVANAYVSIKQYDKAIALYKKLLTRDAKSIPLRSGLAQAYVSAGMKWMAGEVLRGIAKDYPEYKDQVEAAIKQIETYKETP